MRFLASRSYACQIRPPLGDFGMPLERLEVLENLEALGFTLIFRGPLLGDLAMPLERLEVLENL